MTEKTLRPGTIAFVSGASSGIGAATARALAERGCRVICSGRRRERLAEVASTLATPGHIMELDLRDDDAVGSLPDRLPEEWRSIGILVNSAGHDIGGREAFDSREIGTWIDIVETNLNGVMRLCHALLKLMLPADTGHIVNIGSLAGVRATRTEAAYVASKFGMHGLTDALRLDYRDTGIRFTEILPGAVRTSFATSRWEGDKDRAEYFYDSFPAILEADDIARCVIFALEQPANVHLTQIQVEPTGGNLPRSAAVGTAPTS